MHKLLKYKCCRSILLKHNHIMITVEVTEETFAIKTFGDFSPNLFFICHNISTDWKDNPQNLKAQIAKMRTQLVIYENENKKLSDDKAQLKRELDESKVK